MQILLSLPRPRQQLLFAPPLTRGEQADGQLALSLLGIDIPYRRRDGRGASHVGQEYVRHVSHGDVGVTHAVGVIVGRPRPSNQGRRGRHDQQARVLLEQKCEVVH